MEENEIIIYNTDDGKSSVKLFATSKQNISLHVVNMLKKQRIK
jgi:hypothetical protein